MHERFSPRFGRHVTANDVPMALTADPEVAIAVIVQREVMPALVHCACSLSRRGSGR